MDTLERSFGNVLAHLRKQNGHTQQTFSLHIGIDRSYYGQIERGEVSITLGKMKKIAEGFNLNLTQLIELAEQKSKIDPIE